MFVIIRISIFACIFIFANVYGDLNEKISQFDDSMLQYIMAQISKLTEEIGSIKTQISDCQKKADSNSDEIDSTKNQLTNALETKIDALQTSVTTQLGQQNSEISEYTWVNSGRYCIWKNGPCPPGFVEAKPWIFEAGNNINNVQLPRNPIGDSHSEKIDNMWDRLSFEACCK